MEYLESVLSWFRGDIHPWRRIAFILIVVLGLHSSVLLIRRFGRSLGSRLTSPRHSKIRTIASLITSMLIFALYFLAIGLVAREAGVSLKAYLASASILGLAIAFGSQGLVQDVVTGVTLVFADLFDVGDMVEISGQTGIVRGVGMRFTVIENPLGAMVYIPNRTVGNVVNYPRGYVRGLVDVTLPSDAEDADRMEAAVGKIVSSVTDQFPGILIAAPSLEGRVRTRAGKVFLRVKFRIWPGRGGPLETAFRQELLHGLREVIPDYPDWKVNVNYEVEKKTTPSPTLSRAGRHGEVRS